jgi:hypothetical protein
MQVLFEKRLACGGSFRFEELQTVNSIDVIVWVRISRRIQSVGRQPNVCSPPTVSRLQEIP